MYVELTSSEFREVFTVLLCVISITEKSKNILWIFCSGKYFKMKFGFVHIVLPVSETK